MPQNSNIPSIRSPSAYSLREEFSHREINRWSSSSSNRMMKIGLFSFETEGLKNHLSVTNHFRRAVVHLAAKHETETARLTDVREALETFYFLL